MTEQQLRQAVANARADIAAAPRVREAILERRTAMLLTATVDEILSVADELRVLDVKVEIARAKATAFGQELAHIDRERARWSGVDMPSDQELDQLLALVVAAYPSLSLNREQSKFDVGVRNPGREFKLAFFAVGRMGRLAQPRTDRYFSSIVDDMNGLLRAHGLGDIAGNSALAAIVAWNDVPFRLADQKRGQQLEVGLARNSGTPCSSEGWRGLLRGKPLRKALPPRMAADHSIGLVRAGGG